jgi:pyridoxal/pyridoxine/pyridoxamine kinase
VELDKVHSLYSANLIPKAETVVMNQLKVDALMEKRIRLEEAKIKQLQVLNERLKVQLV